MSELINNQNTKVLKALLDLGPGKATAEYLALVCDMGVASVYRSIEKLRDRDILHKTGTTYSINSTNPFVQKFSELLDAEKMISLNPRAYQEVVEVANEIRNHFGESDYSLAAFGSYVRGTATTDSDVDILLVVAKEPGEAFPIESTHMLSQLTVMTREQFTSAWKKGNEVARSSVSWGVLLHDPWRMLYDYRTTMPRTPVTTEALMSARKDIEKMLERFRECRELKNWELGQSLGARTAIAIGRALLMETGVTPRTRPEIPRQLQKTGYSTWRDVGRLASGGTASKKAYDETSEGIERLYTYFWNLTAERTRFCDLLSIIWGQQNEAMNSLCAIFKEIGAKCSGGQGADFRLVDKNGEEVALEYKSTTRGIDGRVGDYLMKRARQGARILIYNPYREYPPDIRSYKVHPASIEAAKRRGISLVPSRALFELVADWTVERKDRGSLELVEILETLAVDTV
ncbi:MAG: hypothetical protein CVT63_03385 [Candidatus Anoxymicrobium japonicum]|uniref:Polymerase nucleotidyl transferase domain-containing protein n=1 Tax=Candidatus Anoxymicrobium japonicum TaxID=2013648 RepID=A0A2N3G6H6_9ACTN|nr:MAG: hypothetical protein CVT63_03385 [Candidatus Anoxymicrobium japonicum]